MKCALWWAGEVTLVLISMFVLTVLRDPMRYPESATGVSLLLIPFLVFGFVVMKKEWGHHAWS